MTAPEQETAAPDVFAWQNGPGRGWLAQYPFVEPGKAGNAIEIAGNVPQLIQLIRAVAFSEGWEEYTITLHMNGRVQ